MLSEVTLKAISDEIEKFLGPKRSIFNEWRSSHQIAPSGAFMYREVEVADDGEGGVIVELSENCPELLAWKKTHIWFPSSSRYQFSPDMVQRRFADPFGVEKWRGL